jgi:hypothetical protein
VFLEKNPVSIQILRDTRQTTVGLSSAETELLWFRPSGHLQLRKVNSKFNAAHILTNSSTPTDIYEDLRRRIMAY